MMRSKSGWTSTSVASASGKLLVSAQTRYLPEALRRPMTSNSGVLGTLAASIMPRQSTRPSILGGLSSLTLPLGQRGLSKKAA